MNQQFDENGERVWYYVKNGVTYQQKYISDDACWAFLASVFEEEYAESKKPDYSAITRSIVG